MKYGDDPGQKELTTKVQELQEMGDEDGAIKAAQEKLEAIRSYRPSSAEICREKGWGPGTVIEGADDSGVVTRITITAVGRERVLAVADDGIELGWSLAWRQWKEVKVGMEKEYCGECGFFFEPGGEHECLPEWLVWRPDTGDIAEDADFVRAINAEDAVEEWADTVCHEDISELWDGEDVEVMVRPMDGVGVRRVVLTMHTTFSANEVEK